MSKCEDLISGLVEEIEGLRTVANWNIAMQVFSGVAGIGVGLVAAKLGRRLKRKCQYSIILARCFQMLISRKFCCYNATQQPRELRDYFIQHFKFYSVKFYNYSITKTVSI